MLPLPGLLPPVTFSSCLLHFQSPWAANTDREYDSSVCEGQDGWWTNTAHYNRDASAAGPL